MVYEISMPLFIIGLLILAIGMLLSKLEPKVGVPLAAFGLIIVLLVILLPFIQEMKSITT